MSDTTVNVTSNATGAAATPAAAEASSTTAQASPTAGQAAPAATEASPPARTTAPHGERQFEFHRKLEPLRTAEVHRSGVMGERAPPVDSPQREAVDRAANAARTTGHRFDLLRYLRLKRRCDDA